jgi:FAD/FMN-containing dehydrogenase
MTSSTIKALTSDDVSLDAEAVSTFAASLRGDLVHTTSDDYDEARSIWNAMIDRRPGLIVRCAGTADVVRAVAFAKEHGLLVSVRGAGHNIAGKALRDGALLVDLSGLRSVHVDVGGKTVRAEPGCTLGDIDHETLAFGLALPVGINSTTGISGLTLGGGFGWLSRTLGMTIDNLISVDVVTADGELVTASADENADLFWGIRGGGGNLGIVTSWHFRLHPVGPNLLCGVAAYPFDDARTVLDKYRAAAAEAPEELTVWAVLRHAPPLPFLPESWHGKMIVVIAMVYAGADAEAGEKATQPFRNLGDAIGEHVEVQPFAGFQQAFDPLLTPGARNYWKSHNFTELQDGLLDTLVEYAAKLPSGQSEIFVAQMGGATNRVAADATVYGHRDVTFIMNVHTRWDAPSEDEGCVSWARQFFEATAGFATGGVYVNFMPDDEADRIGSAYGANQERLAQVKKAYDPENFFRVNWNVAPA